MSLSSYTLDYFDVAREELHIPRGLIPIGETRFGSIYWSLDSALQGFPAFIKIVRDTNIGIESQVSSEILSAYFNTNEYPICRCFTNCLTMTKMFLRFNVT
jgi:hypothetical protein